MKKETTPIKLCFISLGAYPLFNPACKATFGGAEVQLSLLATELAKDPVFDVHFIVGDYGQKSIETWNGIKVYKLPEAKNRIISFLTQHQKIWFLYLIIKIRADVYVQRAAAFATGLICLFAQVLYKKFIYMTAHEIDCNGGYEKNNTWIHGKLFQYGIRHADLVITQNKDHQKMVYNHHRKDSMVMASMYRIPSRQELSEVIKKNILWVGRAVDWKQPKLFIALAQQFPAETFTMISPRSPKHPDFFDTIKAEVSKVPNLTFIDFVPFAEIDAYFKSAKIYVLTSKYEGFPNTFVQAAKNMTPILSLNVNPDGFLDRYKCGLYARGDVGVLTQNLQLLLTDDAKRLEMGGNAYTYAVENHDINKIVSEYKKIFGSLAQG